MTAEHPREDGVRSRRLLIVYGTGHEQTARIARRMAEPLTESGHVVMCVNANALPRDVAPRQLAGVIIGATTRFGRHQRGASSFVRAHRAALTAMPSACFSASGSAASAVEAERARARQLVDEFLRDAGWRSVLAEAVAGAMAYTRYRPLVRWLAKRETRKAGGPTATTRDHEYTDWTQVRRSTEAFAAMAPRPGGTEPAILADARR